MKFFDKRSKAQKFMDDIDPAVSALMDAGCPKERAYRIVFQSMAVHVLVAYPAISEECVRTVNRDRDKLAAEYRDSEED